MALLPYVKIGDYQFVDVQEWSESLDSRVNETEIPRRHGALISDNIYAGTRTISFKGQLHSNVATTLRYDLTLLQSYLNNLTGTQQLWVHDDRYLNAVKKSCSVSYPTGTGFQVAEWNVTFVCGDPFYYASTNTSGATNALSGAARTISYAGTAPAPLTLAIYPTVPQTGLTLYHIVSAVTVGYLRYSGTIAAAAPGLVVNAADFTAVNAGVNALTAFEGDFFNLRYTPGTASLNNVFKVVASGSWIMATLYTARYF